MRRKRSKQKHQIFCAILVNRVLLCNVRLIIVHCVDKLHKSCNRGVERERAQIVGDALYGVVAHAIEFFLRLSERCVVKVDFVAFFDDTLDSVEETADGFKAVVVPRTTLDVVESEHEIHSENVRSVLCDRIVGRYDVALGL